MKSRIDKEREIRREQRDRFVFWLLRIGWIGINIIVIKYWRHLGWWFYILCLAILILGLIPIEKRLIPLEAERKDRKIRRQYPYIKGLENGQVVNILMKSGEVLENVMLVARVEKEILIIKRSKLNSEIKNDDIRTIKLKRIKSITEKGL
ncbi:hypothetical protein [Robertmurraya andreesenii]|uniref:Uncharacterized protein n=1 Tax=Anoxybacillus andreesenii TaxID=1325932 RepID=A0ABT9V4E8_9BACL|nr:hypothetical protein [Robertmurraya andreesenii]MDQ0155816.1 hypothetical protein [Robertmurraya andreesenii]